MFRGLFLFLCFITPRKARYNQRMGTKRKRSASFANKMRPSDFASRVVELMEKREGVFANRFNIEDWVPANLDPKGKACFLFFLAQLDYATKSTLLYEGARELYTVNPRFFTAEFILGLTEKDLTDLLAEYLRPRYINEAVFRYRPNSQKLIDLYQGDPRNIFSSKNAPAILMKIWEFRGFGPKTGNLFFRSMVTTFEMDLENIDGVLPPVDIHDVRIAKLMGFVENDRMTERNVRSVKEMWGAACKKARVNWLVFDKALWLLGSVGRPTSKESVLKLLNL